jgi:hypothetical protein
MAITIFSKAAAPVPLLAFAVIIASVLVMFSEHHLKHPPSSMIIEHFPIELSVNLTALTDDVVELTASVARDFTSLVEAIPTTLPAMNLSLSNFPTFFDGELVTLKEKAVYVRGGGFAGFFWTLGYLDATRAASPPDESAEERQKDYYCYSGGCLSVVCHLLNITLSESVQNGGSLQREWYEGTLSRYEIVNKFIDVMYEDAGVYGMPEEERERVLEQINVMVTSFPGMKLGIVTPKDFKTLKSLLIQTSYIPVITGNKPYHSSSGNVDGYISSLFGGHPEFETEVPNFPWSVSGLKLSLTEEDAGAIYEQARVLVGAGGISGAI